MRVASRSLMLALNVNRWSTMCNAF